MRYQLTAELMRAIRRASRLSQRELAALSGTSGPTIAAYESGSKEPRLSTLVRVAARTGRALEVRLVPAGEGARQRRRRELRSLAVAAAVAAAAERDFGAAQRVGRAGLARAASTVGASSSARRWLDDWATALDAGPQRVRSILLDRTDYGHDMRQASPLAGLISDGERLAALAAAEGLFHDGPAERTGP